MSLEEGIGKGIAAIKDGVIKSLRDHGRYATGKTEKALKVGVKPTDNGFVATLSGPKYIGALQDGRKPTPEGAKSSDGEFLRAIKEWMSSKGIKGSAFAILNSIHKKGYKGIPGAVSSGFVPEKAKAEIKAGARDDIKAAVLKALR